MCKRYDNRVFCQNDCNVTIYFTLCSSAVVRYLLCTSKHAIYNIDIITKYYKHHLFLQH